MAAIGEPELESLSGTGPALASCHYLRKFHTFLSSLGSCFQRTLREDVVVVAVVVVTLQKSSQLPKVVRSCPRDRFV